MPDTSPPGSSPSRFRTGALSPRKPTDFAYVPDEAARAELARTLGLLAIGALSFKGSITPRGRDEMELNGRLTAKVDQACVVTLDPVPARITEEVRRRYVAGLPDPEGEEVEMPEDDATEPMSDVIDLAGVAAEALALALPLYPRAPGAELGQIVQAPPGAAPLEDVAVRPFAGLADLAKKLKANPTKGGTGGV